MLAVFQPPLTISFRRTLRDALIIDRQKLELPIRNKTFAEVWSCISANYAVRDVEIWRDPLGTISIILRNELVVAKTS